MKVREAIERLQAEQGELRDGATVSVLGLLEIVYRDHPRVVLEYKARTRMVLDADKAKREAGYPRTAKFFRDVWPDALNALRGSGSEPAGILAMGAEENWSERIDAVCFELRKATVAVRSVYGGCALIIEREIEEVDNGWGQGRVRPTGEITIKVRRG